VNGRRIRVFLLAALAAVALAGVLAGCGDADSKEAKQILRRGFATSIPSANITIQLTGKVDGIPQLSRPIRIQLAGPYRSNGSRSIPSLSWDVSIAGGGQAFSTGLLSTGQRAFVIFQGTAYELDPKTLSQLNARWTSRRTNLSGLGGLGLHPIDWVKNASKEGDAQVAGVKTTHVSASLDVGKMLSDLNHLRGSVSGLARTPKLTSSEIDQVKKVVQSPTFDVYVGKADGRIRRIAANIEFKVPSKSRARLNGLQGGTVAFSIELASVGRPQRIAPPPHARPMSQLRQQLLGGLGRGLGGGIGALGGSSGAGGANPKLQRYSQCLEKAKPSDTAALQRCSALLK